MCSIFALLDITGSPAEARDLALERSRLLRHRGPDWSGVCADERAVLAHERLSIVGVDSGAQPLQTADGKRWLAVNGEIYNHRELREEFESRHEFLTHSDCEVILPLWKEAGNDLAPRLNGIFAFVAYDSETGDWLIGRDPMGVIPLYWGRDERGVLMVASEVKALHGICTRIEEFPPGHTWAKGQEAPTRYYEPEWREYDACKGVSVSPEALREGLEAAVHRQLMCDTPYGVLLSGGLDSSVIAAIAAKYAEKRIESDDQDAAWWPRLHSFAIGLEGSPDLAAAATAASDLGTVHHQFQFTVQEGLDALPDVIRHIETYDVTTIRASTPMFLLARRIKAMGIKMVLSGEGADEIFGGYLYFHKAPNAREFHEETVRKLDGLHSYDCLRANKSMAAWGVEARVPFLDLEFLDLAMSMDAEHKLCVDGRIEKHVLRNAFEGALPKEILWRQKEQFSDGVGYSWIDSLRETAESRVSDEQMAQAEFRFAVNTPATKEAYWYRHLFDESYPGEEAARLVPGGPSVACSTPTAIAWDESFAGMADPSGRAVRDVHDAGY
ncbi:MAG: asparagine synthase (glutamine-hydrolyzing) [Planctomycetota bacterium]|jgi:asparagine synthase (glutamine-hydrolysing)